MGGSAVRAPHGKSKYDELRRQELVALLEERDARERGGLRLTYAGQTPPWQIIRRVKPRRQRIDRRLSVGSEDQQSNNLIVEGENLQAMVSLYKYRGQVDLILTDPPYNTGNDFRYNDRWDEDPNDPDLGSIVPADDGSRHSKWLRFMTPRIWMMREMLKPGGVIAICIDHRELFRLGMLMDDIFQEENRLALINWQKTTAKNQATHVSVTTEYVLVYAKSAEAAKTGETDRSALSEARFHNPDKDRLGDWKRGDLTGKGWSKSADYAVQSPFTGEFHNPPDDRHWANKRSQMQAWLEEWAVGYEDFDSGDGRGLALALKGWGAAKTNAKRESFLAVAKSAAMKRWKQGSWPYLYWGLDAHQKPVCKQRKAMIRQGAVPTSFWVDDDEGPVSLEDVSWLRVMSGRSRDGVEELNSVVGKGHSFETVKPLKLFTKIIQIWCKPSGIVMDPFAGSGTTGHAVLELNRASGSSRRFVLVEQGRPERGDPYARALTAERIRRVITGGWDAGKQTPCKGGFRFTQLSKAVDADAVLALKREEMIDLLLTSHWDQAERAASYLCRLPAGTHSYLFATSASSGQGFFLVWESPAERSVLDRATFRAIAEEAKEAGLKPPYHVYARICTYSGPNIEFYQIPNRILEKLGFNEASQPFFDGDSREETREHN